MRLATILRASLPFVPAIALAQSPAPTQTSFRWPQELSDESGSANAPGGSAIQPKVVRLVKTAAVDW